MLTALHLPPLQMVIGWHAYAHHEHTHKKLLLRYAARQQRQRCLLCWHAWHAWVITQARHTHAARKIARRSRVAVAHLCLERWSYVAYLAHVGRRVEERHAAAMKARVLLAWDAVVRQRRRAAALQMRLVGCTHSGALCLCLLLSIPPEHVEHTHMCLRWWVCLRWCLRLWLCLFCCRSLNRMSGRLPGVGTVGGYSHASMPP